MGRLIESCARSVFVPKILHAVAPDHIASVPTAEYTIAATIWSAGVYFFKVFRPVSLRFAAPTADDGDITRSLEYFREKFVRKCNEYIVFVQNNMPVTLL